MKQIIIYTLPILLLICQLASFAQSNDIIIGVESDSIYINDFEDIELYAPYFEIDYYYIDIDNNGKSDIILNLQGWINHSGYAEEIYLTTSDNTLVTIDTSAIQWIGPCGNTSPDTTTMIYKYSDGDTLSINSYYSYSNRITWGSKEYNPCYYLHWIDDWVGETHYIGFKKINDTKTYLGWVKIEVVSMDHMILKETAINTYFEPRKLPTINEFMAWNQATIADEYGEFDSWIELYNPHSDSIWLGELFLTSNAGNSSRWKMPDIYMDSGEFLIFWADKQPEQGQFHTDFDINAGGIRVLGIYDNNNKVVESHYYAQQSMDISEGRYPDATGGAWVSFNIPTPGASNESINIYEQSEISSLILFPNPANGNVVNLSKTFNYKVYNIYGQIIGESINSNQINISGYKKGIYIVVSDEGVKQKLIIN